MKQILGLLCIVSGGFALHAMEEVGEELPADQLMQRLDPECFHIKMISYSPDGTHIPVKVLKKTGLTPSYDHTWNNHKQSILAAAQKRYGLPLSLAAYAVEEGTVRWIEKIEKSSD